MSETADSPITLRVNGNAHAFTTAPTIGELLAAVGMAGRRVAVEVNREIVPRGQHATYRLRDGDELELVQAMGGG
jgi:sulfur carrier protein